MRIGNKWVTKTDRKLESKNYRKYASTMFFVWIIVVAVLLWILR